MISTLKAPTPETRTLIEKIKAEIKKRAEAKANCGCRNNALVPWKSVGFLKEPNRMDVLLSRARHKLIIVGSWDFFASRCDVHTPPDAEYAYLGRMMKLMEKSGPRQPSRPSGAVT